MSDDIKKDLIALSDTKNRQGGQVPYNDLQYDDLERKELLKELRRRQIRLQAQTVAENMLFKELKLSKAADKDYEDFTQLPRIDGSRAVYLLSMALIFDSLQLVFGGPENLVLILGTFVSFIVNGMISLTSFLVFFFMYHHFQISFTERLFGKGVKKGVFKLATKIMLVIFDTAVFFFPGITIFTIINILTSRAIDKHYMHQKELDETKLLIQTIG